MGTFAPETTSRATPQPAPRPRSWTTRRRLVAGMAALAATAATAGAAAVVPAQAGQGGATTAPRWSSRAR